MSADIIGVIETKIEIEAKELNELDGITFSITDVDVKNSEGNVVGNIRPQIDGTLIIRVNNQDFLIDGKEIFKDLAKRT